MTLRAEAPRPYTLIAELTYRCPLRCPYCSNPIDYRSHGAELATSDWQRVFVQAEALGVVQLNLTGGEPLVRPDLEALVASARASDLFVNLITSGVPLHRERLARLKDAGLTAIQLSIQGVDKDSSDRVAGARSFEQKMRVAEWVAELQLPLTVNIVLHRENLTRVGEAIALAERLGAHRVELANAQYLGWAFENRAALLPSAESIERAREVAQVERRRLEGRLDILFVLPDYHAGKPRACMDGWARRFVHVTPSGVVLPCHAAQSIPGLRFDRITSASLAEIWERSPAMQAFRGDAWMTEPCRSCSRKDIDFGGCRCQAFLLTGDPAATDPACALSPHHDVVKDARALASAAPTPDPDPPRRYLYRGALR